MPLVANLICKSCTETIYFKFGKFKREKKVQRYQIKNELKNILIVFLREKAGTNKLNDVMLPRMGSNSDCNVYREKSCKIIENPAGFLKTFLFKSLENSLD